jgi:hypothetical protein
MKNNATKDSILFIKLVILSFCIVFFYFINNFNN